MICNALISQYENCLENIKKKVSNEEMMCYFAQDHIETLLKEEKRLKKVFEEICVATEIIEEIDSLITQTKQFLNDIIVII